MMGGHRRFSGTNRVTEGAIIRRGAMRAEGEAGQSCQNEIHGEQYLARGKR
jgi:hypothetical protein